MLTLQTDLVEHFLEYLYQQMEQDNAWLGRTAKQEECSTFIRDRLIQC